MDVLSLFSFLFLVLAILWSFYLKWPQFRVFRELSKKGVVTKDNKSAFFVSLATNLGAGNLIGVTAGILLGGPGVILWMWIFAFFSSSFSYLENCYSVKYQKMIGKEHRGGACFYILRGLNNKWLSLVFSLFLIMSNTLFFPPVQINAIKTSVDTFFNVPKIFLFLILGVTLSLCVFRGTKRIIKLSEKIVVIMTISFVLSLLYMIFANISALPQAIEKIFTGAFSLKAVGVGGILNTMSLGIRRSLFSHEAGLGTVPSISGMSDDSPKTQGYFQMLGVFVDTMLLCTITGLMIVMVNPDLSGSLGSDLLVEVFESQLGIIGKGMGAIFLFLFSFASIMGQYYLGESNALFLTQVTNLKPNMIIKLFRVLYLVGIGLGIYISTIKALVLVDLGMIALGLMNLLVLFSLERKDKWINNIS